MQELTRELTSDEIEVVSGGDNKAVNEALGLVVATTAIAVNLAISIGPHCRALDRREIAPQLDLSHQTGNAGSRLTNQLRDSTTLSRSRLDAYS